jgi:hypothetical protein
MHGLFMPAFGACSHPQSWQQLQDRTPRLEWQDLAHGFGTSALGT